MPDWVTHAQAAEILGCHPSYVPRLIAKQQLTPRGTHRLPSLDRDQVVALAEIRAQERASRAPRPRGYQRVDHRPDTHHEWLTVSEVARLLGITRTPVRYRIQREQLPATQNGGRWWIRRDLLEQVEAARLVQKTRRP